MADPNELKAAVERLIAGSASDADRDAVRTALVNGVLVTGKQSVAIGGNASDVSITTGDQIVFSFTGSDAATAVAALGSISPTRLHQVPPPPADFTGREGEQRELLAAIEKGGVTISGLQGLGGIGKTALALKLVEHLKPRYPDAQFYLDLKGASAQPLSAAEALAHVIRSYHPAAKLPVSETELRALYLSVLEGKRAILLMDNAAGEQQVEPLIPPHGCLLIVTSRQHFVVPGLAAKNLDALTETDARALLLGIAPRIESYADEIAKLCGYLPLALRLAAGALVKYRNLKPADYVKRLSDEKQRLQLIEASLTLSYQLLTEERRRQWRFLSVFPDSFEEDAAAAVWNIELFQTQLTLEELITTSLVEWNETSSRYRLHDLARLYADAKLSVEESYEAAKIHAIFYGHVLSAATALFKEGGPNVALGLALFDREWRNMQAGHDWVAQQGAAGEEDVVRLAMSYPDEGVYILHMRQRPREWIQWLELSLSAAERLNDRGYQAATLGNLGVAFGQLGETQRAIQYHEKNIDIAREIGDRQSEANAFSNLGLTYLDLGETKRALDFFERHLSVARELDDRRGQGIALGNLGAGNLQIGNSRSAIEFLEQQLAIVREMGDRRGQGNALSNLGLAYFQLGDNDRAMQLFQDRLLIAREIGDLEGEGLTLLNLGVAFYQAGDRDQAINYAEQSLRILEQMEDRHAVTARRALEEWREN